MDPSNGLSLVSHIVDGTLIDESKEAEITVEPARLRLSEELKPFVAFHHSTLQEGFHQTSRLGRVHEIEVGDGCTPSL